MSRQDEIIQHKILVRLARKAQSTAVASPPSQPAPVQQPKPATVPAPEYGQQQIPQEGAGDWPHAPAVTQSGVTHGSPVWAHGNEKLKTDAESKYVVPGQTQTDKANVLGTSEGFPRLPSGAKAPPAWRDEAEQQVKAGKLVGDNLYANILAVSTDPASTFGKIASQSSQVVRNAFIGSSHLFSSVRNAMGKFGDRFQDFLYLTHMPVAAMIHNIRTKIAAGREAGLSDEELAHLEKQYKFYTQEMTGMAERGAGMDIGDGQTPLIDKREKRLPLLPNDEGNTGAQSGAQPPKPEKKKKAVGPDATGKAADDQNTAKAKAINHNAMAFLNRDIFALYRQMRDEARANIPQSKTALKNFYSLPENRKPIEDSIREQIESGTHPDYDSFLVNGKRGQKVLSEHKINTAINNHITDRIESEVASQKAAHKERIKALGAIEHALSTANFSMSTLANMGNSDTRNFADWYDSGSTRTTAALVHYINTNPNWSAARNKFGRIEGFNPQTHQPDPNSPHKRLVFDNHDQIAGLTSLMSMLGPTSANEKPSNNAKIALGLLDEGIHQWNLKNGDTSKEGPTALDILAHAPIDKRAYGLISEYKGQKNYKFWSGLYHAAKNAKGADKKKLGALKDIISTIGSGNSSPDLEKDIGNYFQNPDGSFRLAPIEDIAGDHANLDEFVNGELADGKFKGNRQAAQLLKELVMKHHGANPVGFEDRVYNPEKVYLRTNDGNIIANPMGLSTRPGSAIKSLHLIKAFHRGMKALNSLPDGLSPEARAEAVTNAIHIAPHADDEFSEPKYLLHHLAGTSDGRAEMGYSDFEGDGKDKRPVSDEENARRHAGAIARFIDKYRGMNPDAAYHDFLTGVHKWDDVNSISPASAPNWVEVDENGNLTHRGISKNDKPGTGGALVQGNKFGNYVTSVYGAATKASKQMMKDIQRYSPYMTVDRVMMEDLMNATGRWLGGVPESEFQRANVHRAAELAALALAEHYGDKEAALHFNKMQAAQWVLIQLANTGLGGNNPTEQLYTGVESADREARINGHRLLKAYAGKQVTPQEAAKLEEWRHFLENEAPLNIFASNGGEAYANLHDQPYVASTGEYGGDAAHEHAQKVLKEKMAVDAQHLFDQMTNLGIQKKHFKREVTSVNKRARPSNSGRVQAVRAGNPAGPAQGAKVSGKASDSVGNLRNGAKHAASVRSLHGPASRPAQPGSDKGSGRSGSGQGADASKALVYRKDGGASGTRRASAPVRYSGQFMRAMLLGTSASAKKFSEQMDGIASQLGVPIRTYTGVGDATSASTPAVAHISNQAVDPDRARYLAAWSGLLGNKRSVMVFHPDPKGTDSLYSVRLPLTDMQKVRAALDSKGIQHRTVVPGRNHTHVFIYDPRRIMRTSVAAMAEDNNADVLESSGHGEFIGRPANSAGADPLAESREHYRRIIADYEERNGQGNGPNQAGPGANSGGSGPPVSGSSAAGRSPSGGTVFRGVTYKGGAFTPAPEQKGPPQSQMGSPQRFQKKKVRLSKSEAGSGSPQKPSIEFKTTSGSGFKNGFTSHMYLNGEKIGHFKYASTDEGSQSDAAIHEKYRGSGLGKLLLLHAIRTADKAGLGFEMDSRTTDAQRKVYDSLIKSKMIDGSLGKMRVTDAGHAALEGGSGFNIKHDLDEIGGEADHDGLVQYSKKKVRLSKETSLATEGMQEAASNPVVKSLSAANDAKQHVRLAYNNSGTHPTNPVLSSTGKANGAIGVSAPIGDKGGMDEPERRPEDPVATSIHFAAYKAGKHQTQDPIAYSSDINAIRHMLANTAEQGITPHIRYSEASKMGHAVGGSGLKSYCDEMQKTLGMAAHGNPVLTQALLSENPPEVNHDMPLEPGVTRLGGYIAPYSGGSSDFMASKAYSIDPSVPGMFNMLKSRDQPFRRDFTPLTPIQYGLMDYLHPSELNHPPVYGTPDGRLFLNPLHANKHMAENPGVIKFANKLHNPWHHIVDRVATYSGVDHIINAIARNSELYNAEKGSSDITKTLQTGKISDIGIDKFKSLLKSEPKRFNRLLDILSEHLGNSDPSLVASSVGGVTPKFASPAGFGNAVIRENTPLSWSLGSSNPDKLTETAARIHNLWANLTDRPSRLHLRVGSYFPGNDKEATMHGFQSASGFDPVIGDYHDGSFTPVSSEPVSSVNVSQITTPTVLAHEMAHHAETMVPGVGRSVMEHAFANSNGEPEFADEYGFGGFHWGSLRTDWTDSPVLSKYARRINPGRLVFTAPWNNGVRRMNNFPGSSEYLSSMTEEFFARPVKMCREHPLVARLILGLMNGALRNVR